MQIISKRVTACTVALAETQAFSVVPDSAMSLRVVHEFIRKSVRVGSFFGSFLVFFMSFKSQVGLLSKDMTCKVQKVKVKVQKDSKKTKKERQSNDTFPDALLCGRGGNSDSQFLLWAQMGSVVGTRS